MQTSVASVTSVGIPGQLVDLQTLSETDVVSKVSEEASAEIPFGVMVGIGTTDDGAVKLTGQSHRMVGVSVHHHPYAVDREVGSIGVMPQTTFGCLSKGRVFVTVEEAVTPADSVHVRVIADGDEVVGAFRASSDVDALVVADFTFTAAASDICTAAAHGLLTGDGPVRLTTSAADLPLNLLTGTDYWIIKINANTFYLATSLANAIAGTPVNIADAGTGTHTVVDTAGTERLATMDISSFARFRTSAGIAGIAQLELKMVNTVLDNRSAT